MARCLHAPGCRRAACATPLTQTHTLVMHAQLAATSTSLAVEADGTVDVARLCVAGYWCLEGHTQDNERSLFVVSKDRRQSVARFSNGYDRMQVLQVGRRGCRVSGCSVPGNGLSLTQVQVLQVGRHGGLVLGSGRGQAGDWVAPGLHCQLHMPMRRPTCPPTCTPATSVLLCQCMICTHALRAWHGMAWTRRTCRLSCSPPRATCSSTSTASWASRTSTRSTRRGCSRTRWGDACMVLRGWVRSQPKWCEQH